MGKKSFRLIRQNEAEEMLEEIKKMVNSVDPYPGGLPWRELKQMVGEIYHKIGLMEHILRNVDSLKGNVPIALARIVNKPFAEIKVICSEITRKLLGFGIAD